MLGLIFLFLFTPDASVKSALPSAFNRLIHEQPSLPRYVEAGYSPLGRVPAVDAVLNDPFYLPTYANLVSEKIKSISDLQDMARTVFRAGGIPIEELVSNRAPVKSAPKQFETAFGPALGTQIYAYWRMFVDHYRVAEMVLEVLTEEEKNWLRTNYDAFFFGKQEKGDQYDFFTTESEMPLKFFQLASKIDLAKLADCANSLAGLVDLIYENSADLALVNLKENFIWEEHGLKLLITSKDHVLVSEEADFFIDLGGNNTIQNNAGGTGGTRAAALHVDLFGENTYVAEKFSQGCGFLGVGILASFGGNNIYKADLYSQGCGFFGVGILANYGGHNRFEINFGGQSCALFGSSLLWNKQGHNSYQAHEGMAQAASSTLGVAFLVDHEGNDNYVSGQLGRGGSRYGGIGQGGATGVRFYPWIGHASFYGGLAFLYNGGGDNLFQTPWLGQGSAYFLSAGILVTEGPGNTFIADYDAQGQGLHLSAGLLLNKAGGNTYKGGWGSIGVGGDRSVGMLINLGGKNYYEARDHSIGTARKPKALGVFINAQGENNFVFQKNCSASIQWPQSPLEWPTAIFLAMGGKNKYPVDVDHMVRGNNLSWEINNHSCGIDQEDSMSSQDLFNLFPQMCQSEFDPLKGWPGNCAFKPLSQAININEIASASYNQRRHLYESLDLKRFTGKTIQAAPLLADLKNIPEDQLNYAALWAMQTENKEHLSEMISALQNQGISSAYARKMAIQYVGKAGKQADTVLTTIMLQDQSEENRAVAGRILATHISVELLPILHEGLKSDSECVRYSIAKGLQDGKVPGVLKLVTALFDDPSFYVRRAAAMTAISLHDKSGIPVLLDTLQNDTLDTGENYGNNLYNTLAHYVGVNFGLNKEAWIQWWNQVKESFEFPVLVQK